MNLFGLKIRRRQKQVPQSLSSVDGRGGWFPVIREAFAGAWQRNITYSAEEVVAFSTVYACVSLIAGDIAKLRIRLVQQDQHGIWHETESPAFSPVLKRPNHYQDRIKFVEQWMLSKLLRGNTYALKVRDQRNVVTRLYILDPTRVKPMVAPDGSVFYALQADHLSGIDEAVMVPASEIIHDIMCALYHPLVGVSPIFACGLAALQGLKIQNHSARFFANHAQPGGILTAPGVVSDEDAKRLQTLWMQQFTGDNAGRVAVIGNGLQYQALTIHASDAQLVEQLKWSAESVCSCFHVPPFMVGAAAPPPYNNVEALWQQYYSQALQNLIESLELCLDEGLELPKPYGTELDLDDLLRMDTATRVKAGADAIASGGVSPNEARRKYFDLPPTQGGDSPMMQQQQFSLAALAERDRDKPFSKPVSSVPAQSSSPVGSAGSDEAKKFLRDFNGRLQEKVFHLMVTSHA